MDQQLRVTYQMIDSHDLWTVGADHKKLARYMFNYLAMMMAISSIFLVIDGRPEALGKKTQLWEYLRTVDSGLYHKMKYRAVSAFTNFPGYQGRSCPSSCTAWPGRSINSTEERLSLPLRSPGFGPGGVLSRLFVLWASLALDFHGQNLYNKAYEFSNLIHF